MVCDLPGRPQQHRELTVYKLHALYRRLCDLLAPLVAWPFIGTALFSDRMNGEIAQSSILVSRIPFYFGERVRLLYYRRLLQAVGADVTIKYGSFFQYRRARVGRRVLVGHFNTMGEVDIGNDVLLGGNITVLSGLSQHSFEDPDKSIWDNPSAGRRMIRIGNDVWIGSNVTVGNDVGDRCVVAAGSVVVKPVSSRTVVGGNPARLLKSI